MQMLTKQAVYWILLATMALLGSDASGDPVIDWAVEKGPVKPVNGVGQPPLIGFPALTMMHRVEEVSNPNGVLFVCGR